MLYILSELWQIAHLSRLPSERHVRTSLIKWSNYFILQHFWMPFRGYGGGCLRLPLPIWASKERKRKRERGRRLSSRITQHTTHNSHIATRISKLCKRSQRVVSGPSSGLSSARICTYHTSPFLSFYHFLWMSPSLSLTTNI